MDKLIYRLDEVSRRLMRETRRAIVFTDNNMVRLIIKIPMTINEKDISTFDYVIKFLVDEVYHERVPDVEARDGYVVISTLFDEKLTDSDGKLRFSFTGYTDGYRYSSTIATTDLKKTISLKGRETPATIEGWLEEIRGAVKEGKAELDGALGDKVRDYLENEMALDYELLDNKPILEGVVIDGDKRFVDYGLGELTKEDISKLF